MPVNPSTVVNTIISDLLFNPAIDPSNKANYQAFVASWEKFIAEDKVGDHQKLLNALVLLIQKVATA